jgi:hypothetical protein
MLFDSQGLDLGSEGLAGLPGSPAELLPPDVRYIYVRNILQGLCDGSTTFANAISNLSPQSALWIDLDRPAPVYASGNYLNGSVAGLPNLRGFVGIEPFGGPYSAASFFQMLSTTGNLGSGLIDHIQKMTIAAMAMADMKVWAQRS